MRSIFQSYTQSSYFAEGRLLNAGKLHAIYATIGSHTQLYTYLALVGGTPREVSNYTIKKSEKCEQRPYAHKHTSSRKAYNITCMLLGTTPPTIPTISKYDKDREVQRCVPPGRPNFKHTRAARVRASTIVWGPCVFVWGSDLVQDLESWNMGNGG
jgi:hypothetical protein